MSHPPSETSLQDVCDYLSEFAPLALAEDWDNVGLLVGDRTAKIGRVMTCLTITPSSAGEAVERQADLIISHHPLPFRSLQRITSDTTPGRLLLQLIRAGIAVYSPHTAFDSTSDGINQQLAEGLGLANIRPLVEHREFENLGGGRFGDLQETRLNDLADRLKQLLGTEQVRGVGDPTAAVACVAVACGSAGEFLPAAREAGCQLLVTGETGFHTCLEAEATGIQLLLTGHYASERFALESLAERLAARFPPLEVWASLAESNPIRWF